MKGRISCKTLLYHGHVYPGKWRDCTFLRITCWWKYQFIVLVVVAVASCSCCDRSGYVVLKMRHCRIAITKWWLSAWQLFSCIIKKNLRHPSHGSSQITMLQSLKLFVKCSGIWRQWHMYKFTSFECGQCKCQPQISFHKFSKGQQYLITMTRTYKNYCMPCVAKGHVSFLLRQLWLLTFLTRFDQVACSTNLLTLNVSYVSSAMWAWRWSMLAAEFPAEPNSF